MVPNLVTIFFLFIIVRIDGIDDDLFDDLWKNLKIPSTSKNFKKQKFGEIHAIKEEIIDKNEIYEQQNANKVEMEDTKLKVLQKIKKEPFEEQNNNLKRKIKEPKIEMDKSSEYSFENPFEQDDQNVLSANQNDSADDDEDYNDMEFEKRNEMESDILNKFNLMKKELRKENIYKNLTFCKFECEIAEKLGTNRTKIYKLKRKLGQKTKENEETKRQLIKKFDQMRKEKICGLKCDEKKRSLIEREIANELGISRDKIFKWKKELVLGKTKIYMDAEKLEYVKRSEEMTKRNPMIIERKIAETLDIPYTNLRRWKRKFGTKRIH